MVRVRDNDLTKSELIKNLCLFFGDGKRQEIENTDYSFLQIINGKMNFPKPKSQVLGLTPVISIPHFPNNVEVDFDELGNDDFIAIVDSNREPYNDKMTIVGLTKTDLKRYDSIEDAIRGEGVVIKGAKFDRCVEIIKKAFDM